MNLSDLFDQSTENAEDIWTLSIATGATVKVAHKGVAVIVAILNSMTGVDLVDSHDHDSIDNARQCAEWKILSVVHNGMGEVTSGRDIELTVDVLATL